MVEAPKTRQQLEAENVALRARLDEAEETLRAIRCGEVDALLVESGGKLQVFTLTGADQVYRLLVEGMRQGAVTAISDGTILFANQRFADMVKSPLEDVIGGNLFSYVVRDDAVILRSVLDYQRTSAELILHTAGAGNVPTLVAAGRLKEASHPAIVLIVSDLTDQKRFAQIAASEQFLRAVMEQSPRATLVCDSQGVIVRASAAATALWGREILMLPFDTALDLRQTHAGGGARKRVKFAMIENNEVPRGFEVYVRRQSTRQHFLLASSRMLDKSGETSGYVISLADITHLKQLKEA